MNTPLVWYDSVSVIAGDRAAWTGFGASLVTVTGHPAWARGGGHTVLDLRSGDFGFDENALSIQRGDSANWLRGEAFAGNRGPALALGVSGRHVWSVAAGVTRGRNQLTGSYAQRGAAASLEGTEEQSGSGQSGDVRYRFRSRRFDAGLMFARGQDGHESFGEELVYSRRDAQETIMGAEVALGSDRRVEARLEWRRARVRRAFEEPDERSFDRRATALWAAMGFEQPVGAGSLRVELGAGHHDAVDRFEWAPGISFRFGGSGPRGRIGFERVLHPLWADLAEGERPFLQQTWAGVAALEGGGPGFAAAAEMLAGRTMDRALVARYPIEEIWLRIGVTRDPDPYPFLLLNMRAQWEGRHFALGSEGFALARERSAAQPLIDPPFASRSWGAWRFTLFGGDLGVTLRGEVDAVGRRESQGQVPGRCNEFEDLARSRLLTGYATSGASAIFALGDAVITTRVRNLEDTRRRETWFDCSTLEDALGPGREWRFALTVKLRN